MAGIFISYRRADSDGWAGRLRDALRARFGEDVFHDVDNIADGEIFSEVIDRALQACDVALIVIGPNWASARGEHGRRLDQEADWVRTETAMVLNRKIRVIPVLVGGASLPRAEELPHELRSLTKRQAREIRSNSWDSDVALLTNQLEQIVGHRRKRPVWLYALPPLVVLVGVGVFAGSRFFSQPTPSPTPADRTAAPPAVAPIQREQSTSAPPAVAQSSKDTASDTPREKQPETPPVTAKSAPVLPKEAPSSRASTGPQQSKTPASGKSAIGRPSAPEGARAGIASNEPPGPAQEPRRAAATGAYAEAPSARTAEPAPEAPKVAGGTIARTAALNLPNRPASARELKIGDSWTYRLREVHFNKNLATVTHEIRGGDTSGIRETLRIGERKPGADSEAEASGGSRGATQRRLPLEARIFEQQLNQNAMLFEFAPFMTAFSELQPGVTWKQIAGASSDSLNEWRFSGKVAGRERVAVPAGNFDAIRAELVGQRSITFPSTVNVASETTPSSQTYSIWFVPEVGRAVKYVRRTYNRAQILLDHEQYELVSYDLK